jgi:predicted KAP-like P-loop ATPase
LQKSVKSIFQLKEEIKTELQELDGKIVIIIDDIDRLTSKEIQELFRALKAVVDFQNIIYLLAYDKEIVIDALEYEFHPALHTNPNNNHRAGIKYLEKIVQFEVPLPVIGEYHLKQYTEKTIFTDLFYDTNSDLFDQTRWTDIYHKGLKQFILTPRSVIRLHNSLELLYPPLKNEVNVIDFICLEIIRQNYPKLYNLIKENHRYFIEDNSLIGQLISLSIKPESINTFHKNWIDSIEDKDKLSVKYIMTDLFPSVKKCFDNTSSISSPSPRKLHIHLNYDTFLKYFRFQTEPDLFSNTELIELLHSIQDPNEFIMIISQLKGEMGRGGSRALVFLEGILPSIDEKTPEELLKNIVIGCFRIENKLITKPEVVNQSVISMGYITKYISKVIYMALTFYPKAKRLELLREAFSTGDSFWLMADGIIIIHQQNGEWDETTISPDRFLKLDELKEIDKIFVEKLQHAFSTDVCAFASPSITTIIYVWNKLSPDDRYLVDAIENIWKNDDSLIAIIYKSYEMKYVGPIVPYSLEPFKSDNEFREKVSDILEKNRSSLNKQQIASLTDFLSTNPPLKVE